MSAPQAISLLEFNRRIKSVLSNTTELTGVWIIADMSDVRPNSGHCYLELIEKNESGATVAKIRATIWASNFLKIKAKFEGITGQTFRSDLKVMVQVSANFHELYGMAVVVTDINPEFTLGDMARQRQEIINRLKADGIIDMNITLPWPSVLQRIAVISAKGAAGYGDFMNQLSNNPYGLQFYTCLFPAVMQGAQTVPSVLAALDRINENLHLFDCVVIIRGGGSTSDLNSFDNYDLASAIAQFPIHVITGIGHERDVTVLDYVAHRVKTPTAAAELIINSGSTALAKLNELSTRIPNIVQSRLDHARALLQLLAQRIPAVAQNRILASNAHLDRCRQAIAHAADSRMMREQMRLEKLTQMVELLSPRNTLRRGYTLTKANGHFITDPSQLKPGDTIVTYFNTGAIQSTVK